MKELNIILVYDKNRENILMCKRTKPPYKGKLNLVGGKIEKDEDHLEAAYRELKEESGILKNDICLKKFMTFYYDIPKINLEVYVGVLNKDIVLLPEINPLFWVRISENFFNLDKFAGEGNIGHIIEEIKLYKDIF